MRILFVAEEYPHPEKPVGGVATYIAGVASVLASHGHDVHVLCCAETETRYDHERHGVWIHRRGLAGVPGLARLSRRLGLERTADLVRRGLSIALEHRRLGVDFDVIEYSDIDAEGWLLAATHPAATVAHLHLPIAMEFASNPQSPREQRWALRLDRLALRGADVVTCPSQLLVDTLRADGHLSDVEPEVIPQFVQWRDWRSTEPVETTEAVVLSLGWLGRNKAPETLVQAMALLRQHHPNAAAVFAGDSLEDRDGLPYAAWLEQTQDLTQCRLLGRVPHDEVPRLLSSARVLALPSIFENYPIAALEAMAAGRPVVVTQKTGIADLVRDSGAGAVVPAGDPAALADALLPYVADPAHAAEAGQRGREAVRANHDPEHVATLREGAFLRALERSRATPRSSRLRTLLGRSEQRRRRRR